jgi:hypothetical protein
MKATIESTTQSRPAQIVQLCSWCLPQTIRVLGPALGVEAAARISFELDSKGFPKSAWTFVGGEFQDLKLSHGICPECRKKFCAEPARVQ